MALLRRLAKRTRAYALLKAARARRELARWSDHDQRICDFYSGLVSPGELCFDVGANIGNRVKIFLALGARVVAVEPQRECGEILESVFGRDERFTLVAKGLGSAEGSAKMWISDADTFSSFSQEWVQAVSQGRFRERSWDRTRTIPITTLDSLIAQHGAPAFVKIDVEGFEHEVVRGLSQPVRALSLEYTPECRETMVRCLDHLADLGPCTLNYSPQESMRWALESWVDRERMLAYLSGLGEAADVWGDVYVRFPGL
jgi:FkbM family methyltransferase